LNSVALQGALPAGNTVERVRLPEGKPSLGTPRKGFPPSGSSR